MFGRRRHVRQDISLIDAWIGQAMLARAQSGSPVPYDQLPVAVGLCNLIADALADMDLYAIDPAGRYAGQQFPVLEQPNPEEDRADTLHDLVQAMFWTGNAEALNGPRDSNGAVDAITVVNPNTVSPIVDQNNELRVARWQVNARQYERSQVTHWKLNHDPRKGPMGRSPLQVCATALTTYGWAYKWLADQFRFSGNPTMVFRPKMEIPPEKIVELSAEWSASREAGRPPFLPQWLEVDNGPGAGAELEHIIAVLEFCAAEFARLLTVPTTVVNAPVSGYTLTYANVGDEFKRWLVFGLGTTWIRRVERGFSTLLPRGLRAHLDPSSLFPTELYGEPLGPDTPTAAVQPDTPAPAQTVPA